VTLARRMVLSALRVGTVSRLRRKGYVPNGTMCPTGPVPNGTIELLLDEPTSAKEYY